MNKNMSHSLLKNTSAALIGLMLIAGLSACPAESDKTAPADSAASPATTEASPAASAATEASPAASAATTAASPAASAASTKMAAGNADNGAKLFVSKTCSTCHTVTKIKAVGTIGPSLDGVAKTAATRVKGLDAEAYLRESIEKPSAFVVPKFQPLMPATIRSTMTDQEFSDIVAFLKTLS